MSENCGEYVIINDEVKKSREFDDNIINSGKSLYEVIRIINGKPLFLENHLERLNNSSKITGYKIWLNEEKISERINKLIDVNKVYIGNIKIVFNFNNTNTILIYFLKHNYPSEKQYKEGVNTILYHGERDNPNAKVINKNFRTAVDKEIKEKDVFEAILINNDGYITEGSKSNIFMVKGSEVITSPIEDVLPGITRNVVIKVCKNLGYNVLEKKVCYKEIPKLNGLFISGTSPKVLPIKKVDSIEYNSAKNEVIFNIMQGYNKIIEEYIKNTKL